MAATRGVNNFHDIVPPVKKIRSKMDERLSEYMKYFAKNCDIPNLRIEWLFDDYETFRKRFEKMPKEAFGFKDFGAYAVMFITVAGVTYVVIKMYQRGAAKL